MGNTSRSTAKDPFQVNRFSVQIINGVFSNSEIYSFQTVTIPEQTIDKMEYSEGIYTYSRSYPGRSTFNTITLSRGQVKGDTLFAKWIRAVSESKNYRVDLKINEYHRDATSGMVDFANAKPTREIVLFNAYAERFRPGSDKDAMSGDISIAEIEVAYERFVILENGQEIRP